MANPLELLLRTYANPVLKAAGFRKQSRHYRKYNDHGDLVALFVQSAGQLRLDTVPFHLEFGYLPAAYLDWREQTTPQIAGTTAIHGLVRRRFDRPLGDDRWEFEVGEDAGLVTDVLREEVIPAMEGFLDPNVALDHFEHPDNTYLANHPYDQLFPLIDQGPSAALDRVWARLSPWSYFQENIEAWATARLAGKPRRADVRAPSVDLPGFTFSDGAHRKSNNRGDQAVVEVLPAHQPGLFRVDSAVVPRLSWESLRSEENENRCPGQVPTTAVGQDRVRLRPPTAHPLDLWSSEEGLVEALERDLPRLDALLSVGG